MSKPSECQVGGDWYKGLKIQPIEFAIANNLGPCETSVLKYICRHNLKDRAKDIHKAIHYLKLILEYEYNDVTEDVCPVPLNAVTYDNSELQAIRENDGFPVKVRENVGFHPFGNSPARLNQ